MTCSELSEFDDLSRKAIDAGNTAVIVASIFSLAVQAVSIIGNCDFYAFK
jgi:diacylglycerol kinase